MRVLYCYFPAADLFILLCMRFSTVMQEYMDIVIVDLGLHDGQFFSSLCGCSDTTLYTAMQRLRSTLIMARLLLSVRYCLCVALQEYHGQHDGGP
jgi:hypothetical protein